MLDVKQLQLHVVRPTLEFLDSRLTGLAAERLVIGTALTESRTQFLDQITGPGDEKLGPAIGLWQIEPATDHDVWKHLRPTHRAKMMDLISIFPERSVQLATNLSYAAAM